MRETFRIIVCLVVPILLVGCGSEQTAPVTGTVTWDGKPVTAGELQFAPQGSDSPGKPGSATIQSDGTFTVSTYGNGDGAWVGTHSVSYVVPPPRPENESTSQSSGEPSNEGRRIQSPYEGLVPEQKTVDVPGGGLTLDVKLVKR